MGTLLTGHHFLDGPVQGGLQVRQGADLLAGVLQDAGAVVRRVRKLHDMVGAELRNGLVQIVDRLGVHFVAALENSVK